MLNHAEKFDVVVIGGGHAGVEAALASARLGAATLLVTQSIDTIGQMSCNPAIGGIGKGHIVREIDALGGAMALAIDRAGIQFRRLNSRKGPAVRATRAQADRLLYRQAIRTIVENTPGLSVFQQTVDDLVVESGRITGVVTAMGLVFCCQRVVLTTGTFLGGLIHIGDQRVAAGRAGDPPANTLAARLRELPLHVDRLKTGTPPRIDGRTINYQNLQSQPADSPLPVFSFTGSASDHPRQVDCHITHTNENTHAIIRESLHRSPLYGGAIAGVGPRYCPSVEDKIVRFADRSSHQIFIEPEGLTTHEVYPNGISTSLPFDVQWRLVRSIAGFESATITRPGYAIEYDFFDPRDLHPWLETKVIAGLYFAGQINGTTGYEEAAGQGLIAGLNAARQCHDEQPWWPRRNQAYIGVMIDDLVTQGTSEPYRMFTSRAEHRLRLREDNADLRLTPKGRELGLVDDSRWRRFEEKRQLLETEQQRLSQLKIHPQRIPVERQRTILGRSLRKETSGDELLRRPDVNYQQLHQLLDEPQMIHDTEVIEQIEIQARYAGYIDRYARHTDSDERDEKTPLPDDFDYATMPGLSAELLQKLSSQRPGTVAQASRIQGMTPAGLSILRVYLKKYKLAKSAA